MPHLSLRQLATAIDGKLSLGDLPPLDGDQQSVGDIHFDITRLTPGDLYWNLSPSLHAGFGKAELAFLRGAGGAIVEHQHSEPWAGRYTLRVNNCQLALKELAFFLRQTGHRRSVLLFPAVAGPRWLGALQSLLQVPPCYDRSKAEMSFGAANQVASSSNRRILTLANLHDPGLHATVLLSTPDLIILGRPDAAWLSHQSPPALHRLVEALPPAGGLLFCDYEPYNPVSSAPAPTPPEWLAPFLAAGIRCLRVGRDPYAELQFISATRSERPYNVRIGSQRLCLPARSLPQAAAEATALGAASLLGEDPTALVRRFKPTASEVASFSDDSAPRRAA